MANSSSAFQQLKQSDYTKLMELLPRLRTSLQRSMDKEGVTAVQITIDRTASKAIGYIKSIQIEPVYKSDGEKLGIIK